ncbi:MAG: NrfD/PsrC family molybdoenzyme membrane anchor subunit [Polaromonas sp.]|jgi:formate-dependent nitrite reductase membrane component NrfD|uniref:NrfD/PsrC family molybdoenzyme membrane anchor subunit n=1 Tax=Polaromonas sp. TaxID=1869339 RepID=UPI00272F8F3A|nr:NrfD/PsrC family molybdoenzyme membrane anchor subunit [Polaromonas sp.]MDP2255593.1 NrfD/PsrC family molybdoenzyme membrane anchor subunit [Polaromonas sp.]MDP3707695.1 NrfD/PsrC family molybdoenzyme membrane anchor subunit [Polaromonas sp.]
MGDYVWFHDVSWHSAYAIYFFVIGICAGLSFFSFLSWHRAELAGLRKPAAYASFALLAVGGVLLIGDLSQPMRFLNVLNPFYLHFTSPLAWGSLNIVTFGVASVAYLLMLRKGNEKSGKRLALVVALLALGLPIYTGYDLSVHQSRPMWNTPVMPVLFVALAMASGAAVSSLLAGANAAAQTTLRQYLIWSVGAVGVILVSMLGTTHYGGSAEELTYIILTTGSMGLIFVGLGIVAGTVAPFALLLAPLGRQQGGVMVAALLVLVGSAALRYAILMAPQQVQTLF